MIYLGFDVSSKTGFSVVCNDAEGLRILKGEEIHSPPLKPGVTEVDRWNDFMHEIAGRLNFVIEKYGVPEFAFIESYAFGIKQSKDTTILQVMLGGCVRMMLAEFGITYHEVGPGVWKKFLSGSGTLKKDQVMLRLYKDFGYEAKTDNIADAVTIALFGAHTDDSIPCPAYRKEAINAWLKSKHGKTF